MYFPITIHFSIGASKAFIGGKYNFICKFSVQKLFFTLLLIFIDEVVDLKTE